MGLLGLWKRRKAATQVRLLQGWYAAEDLTREFALPLDLSSPNAANTPAVRQKLRALARYEFFNNSYCWGLLETLANDIIGPRVSLQITDALDTPEERAFTDWATEINLWERLRTAIVARLRDGEVFLLLTTSRKLESPVKLDIQLIEADRVASPFVPNTARGALDGELVDGIEYDAYGNPVAYHVLRVHPGATSPHMPIEYLRIPAENLLHYYRPTRPGQARGIPEITPALPLFMQLRRYTLAVLAAETAAGFSATIYTDAPAQEPADLEPMDAITLQKRMATVLPGGWKIAQLQAQQPNTEYAPFKNELLREIARCLHVPYNIVAGNSADLNYASGRLDHQVYHRKLRVEQADLVRKLLDPIFAAFSRELTLEGAPPHKWYFPGFAHVDPEKEANAAAIRLQHGLTTLAAEYANIGLDWRASVEQRAVEKRYLTALGLSDEQDSLLRAPNKTRSI